VKFLLAHTYFRKTTNFVLCWRWHFHFCFPSVLFCMSAKVIISSSDPIAGPSTYPYVSLSYILAMYLLAGLSVLLSVVLNTGFFTTSIPFITVMSITSLFSFTGLIMSNMNRARGTKNRSKFVSVFSLIMSAMIIQGAAMVIIRVVQLKIEAGRLSSLLFYYIPLCLISQLLIMISGIILLTFKASQEYTNCPKLAMSPKLLIGIPGLIGALCAAIRLFLRREPEISLGLYYLQVICVSLISLGIVLGVVFAFIEHKYRNKSAANSVSQSVIVSSIESDLSGRHPA